MSICIWLMHWKVLMGSYNIYLNGPQRGIQRQHPSSHPWLQHHSTNRLQDGGESGRALGHPGQCEVPQIRRNSQCMLERWLSPQGTSSLNLWKESSRPSRYLHLSRSSKEPQESITCTPIVSSQAKQWRCPSQKKCWGEPSMDQEPPLTKDPLS